MDIVKCRLNSFANIEKGHGWYVYGLISGQGWPAGELGKTCN